MGVIFLLYPHLIIYETRRRPHECPEARRLWHQLGIYKDHFSWAIDARGLLEHVDGPGREPTRPTLGGEKAGGSSKEGERVGEVFVVVEEFTTEEVGGVVK